jgi:hypothetical protein
MAMTWRWAALTLTLALGSLALPGTAPAEDDYREPVKYIHYGDHYYNNSSPFKPSLRSPIVDNINSNNSIGGKKMGRYRQYGPAWLGTCGCSLSNPGLSHPNGYKGCYDFMTTHEGCDGFSDGTENAVWIPSILADGEYDVWVSFSCTVNRANPAIYEVWYVDEEGKQVEEPARYAVNQARWGCYHDAFSYLGWAKLGKFRFARQSHRTPEPKGFVRIVQTDISGGSECADAVGFRYVPPTQ